MIVFLFCLSFVLFDCVTVCEVSRFLAEDLFILYDVTQSSKRTTALLFPHDSNPEGLNGHLN